MNDQQSAGCVQAAHGYAVFWRRPDPMGRLGDKQAYRVSFLGLADSKLKGNPELSWLTDKPVEDRAESVILVSTNPQTLKADLLDRWKAALQFEEYGDKVAAGMTLGDWHRQQQAGRRMLRPFAKPKELRRVERLKEQMSSSGADLSATRATAEALLGTA